MMDENWSVKNQARMSDKYKSSEDAVSYWPETCTCIAVKIVPGEGIKIIAPAGIEDPVSLVVRRGIKFEDEAEYGSRIKRKEWEKKWPGLKII